MDRLFQSLRMKRHGRVSTPAAAGWALAVWIPVISTSVSAGDLDNGRKLAREHCARCHVVDEASKFGGIGSTPSFRLLVSAFKDWRTRFETFYARRPHPAFVSIEGRGRLREDLPPNAHPVILPASAVEDLLAVAQDLKDKAAGGAIKAKP